MENSTAKGDLALELASYSFREQMQILKAARCLKKYARLTKEKLSKEEELDKEIEELEK